MSDIIRLLPDTVINRIAAGEIISNPSYIVKELLENAIDAGATRIQIKVVEGGRSLIQITDNGKGMSPTDARMAFEKHATSKISSIEDLDSLHTKGFRGEALNAIADVSFVEMRTRPKGEELGTEVVIHGGEFKSVSPCVCPEGTTFIVKDIFFNFKVRRQALSQKSVKADFDSVKQEFERVALVHPKVAMSLYNDNSVYRDLLASSLKERILALSFQRTKADLLPIHSHYKFLEIEGFIGKPDSARKKKPKQFFFVNNRYVQHQGLKNALVNTYLPYIGNDDSKEPMFFIYLKVPPETIDINISVHKTEIQFFEEEMISKLLCNLVRSTLGANAMTPSIDFEQGAVDIPPSVERIKVDTQDDEYQEGESFHNKLFMNRRIKTSSTPISLNLGTTSSKDDTMVTRPLFSKRRRMDLSQERPVKLPKLDVEQVEETLSLFEHNEEKKQVEKLHIRQLNLNKEGALGEQTYFFFKSQYLLTSSKSEVLIIDYRRAYERILYDEYLREIDADKLVKSQKLFPEILSFYDNERDAFARLRPELERVGFIFEEVEDKILIREAPDLLDGAERDLIEALVYELLTDLEDSEVVTKLNHSLALEIALKTAPSLAQGLTLEKIDTFISKLFSSTDPNITPSGNRIIISISEALIDSWF